MQESNSDGGQLGQAALIAWTEQHSETYVPVSSRTFEATVAHGLKDLQASIGGAACCITVTPRLQNDYGRLGGVAACGLQAIMADVALRTYDLGLAAPCSCYLMFMRGVPVTQDVQCKAEVVSVANGRASIEVILTDVRTGRVSSKGRWMQAGNQALLQGTSPEPGAATAAGNGLLRRAQAVNKDFRHDDITNSFSLIARQLQEVKAHSGHCSATLRANPELQGRDGSLHVGCLIGLSDLFSAAALTGLEKFLVVSIDLHAEVLESVMVGEDMHISTDITYAGRTLAFSETSVRYKASNRVIAVMKQAFYIGQGSSSVPLTNSTGNPHADKTEVTSKL